MSHPFFLVIGRDSDLGCDIDLGVFPGATEDEAIAAFLASAGATEGDGLIARRAVGAVALRAAKNPGVTLHKHADPIDDAREVSLDEAEDIAREDASLIYATA